MIYDHNITNGETLGPFAIGEWSMYVPPHYLSTVTPWFIQNRGDFSVLVHPNTGCEYEDHSNWAQWAGSPWNMDMSIFTEGMQTNKFGESAGND
jgi:aromatic ring-cleaving dioxygenase